MRWVAGFTLLAASYLACAGQATTPRTGQTPPSSETQAPMTKEQAKELFRSVDEILSFASSDTKLPIEHTVKRKLISRDEVNQYLREKFDEDEGAKRMERSEIVLKKFRLPFAPFSSLAADGADCRILRQQDEDGEPAGLD
jgi:hypothetical protein